LETEVHFRARILIRGINPYVIVSPKDAEKLSSSWRKALPVSVQLNDHPDPGVRTNLMPRGEGSFYLYVNGAMRKASGTSVGDTVRIRLTLDTDYRPGPIHRLPSQFRQALSANTSAKAAWKKLAPSSQKEILRYFAGLKTSSALQRNIDQAIAVLGGKKARFMAKDWN
jgi:hypothetical protein